MFFTIDPILYGRYFFGKKLDIFLIFFESEIKQNSWHIIASDMDLVFDTLPNLVVDKLSEKIGYNLRTIISGENSH